ncbi:hypothetical protein [Algibacter sp. 2305UL17-15]|uniref:hypothetical protein n=1 Tax=Algibacter sp. 2305UL17-15 TaxID=3231268 RepID=UPI00345A5128
MKRVLLVFTSMLIGLTTVSATELNHQTQTNTFEIKKNYHYAQPIIFMERGIEFLIFPDGSFDFNTNVNNNYRSTTNYRRSSRRSTINRFYHRPNARMNYNPGNRGVYISRDRNGTIRRIGNVFLNYDRHGRLTRVGSIFMNYSRGKHSSLKRVGGLQVDYNRWGDIEYLNGQVNHFYRDYCNFCGVQSCGITHDFETKKKHGQKHRNRNDDIYQNNDNYYYYKGNGKVKKHKRKK